jgi:hypothetical protein
MVKEIRRSNMTHAKNLINLTIDNQCKKYSLRIAREEYRQLVTNSNHITPFFIENPDNYNQSPKIKELYLYRTVLSKMEKQENYHPGLTETIISNMTIGNHTYVRAYETLSETELKHAGEVILYFNEHLEELAEKWKKDAILYTDKPSKKKIKKESKPDIIKILERPGSPLD